MCAAPAGKTLIARQIGKMLNGREPKVVNGPEVLNKYVGASEENIRKLFVVGVLLTRLLSCCAGPWHELEHIQALHHCQGFIVVFIQQ